MNQKLVIHYQDGTILKGNSNDFFPNKAQFHLRPVDGSEARLVKVADLKGVFTVRTFEGDPDNRSRRDVERAGLGRKIKVTFKDGEVVVGYTSGYSPDRPAFFVFPADPDSNTERIFVVTDATQSVEFT
ncbi:MAG: hypothetical protein P1T08_14115 [Acidimicrobiia bacterium]|nr:hypothetical protein [Acidimicrobiia bacterium]